MKSLQENEMIEVIQEAEKNGKLDKFAIAGFLPEGITVRTFLCTIEQYSMYEILLKSPCFHGSKVFHKSEDDNRFYCMDDGAFWALCVDVKEANSIAKVYSETNEFCRSLSTRMRFLTVEELQPIAIYLEGCFERRLK